MRCIQLVSVIALGCSSNKKPAPVAAPAKPVAPDVEVTGAFKDIIEGKTEGRIDLSSVVPGPGLFGIGALTDVKAELTILDDQIWVSYAQPKPGVFVLEPSTKEQATLLVRSKARKFHCDPVVEDVPFSAIEDRIEEVARRGGFDTSKAFLVKIEGAFADLEWHVGSTLPTVPGKPPLPYKPVSGKIASCEGTVIGFYSTQHEGVFTKKGGRTHFHVIVPSDKHMGHLDSVTVKKSANVCIALRD